MHDNSVPLTYCFAILPTIEVTSEEEMDDGER